MNSQVHRKGSIAEAVSAIQAHDKIVIFHHIRPDGDCLGAQHGLARLIQTNFPHKQVFCVGDPKHNFSWLEMVFTPKEQITPELMQQALAVIVDANYKERIECRDLLDQNQFKAVLRIDHHPNEDDLNTTHNFVDASYIAAAEQVVDLAVQAKWKLSPPAATALYLGIYTDSNRFLYSNTSWRTLYLGSMLYRAQANIAKIHDELNHTSLKDIQFKQYVFKNFQTFQNVIYFVADKKFQKKLKVTPLECARVNILANIEQFHIWLFFIEEGKNHYRVEFRSNGINVREVALKYGGGGHIQASGAVLKSKRDIIRVVQDCQKQIAV